MSWECRNRERDLLLRELGTPAGCDLLRTVEVQESISGPACGWTDVATTLKEVGLKTTGADAVLRAVLLSRRCSPAPPWSEALLYLFFDMLVALHQRKSRWDRDPEARWANLQWCFLKSIHGIDPDVRRERVGQKLVNDTTHRLHDHYRPEWDRRRCEVWIGSDELAELTDTRPGIDFDGIDLRAVQRTGELELRRLLQRGRITQADHDLELGTRICGGSLGEYAAVVGLNYQVAKKRRQRLETRLRTTYRR